MFRILGLVLFLFSLAACSGSSNDFATVLGNEGGGTGFASIAINNFSPSSTNVSIKKENSQNFLVAAVGDGTLTYEWTLDGNIVGGNTASYTINAPDLAIGLKVLKVSISDSKGAVSQEWNVKINGAPQILSALPSVGTTAVRQEGTLGLGVSVSDPNGDSLTYIWKVNGVEGILTSTGSLENYIPSPSQIGPQTLSVEIFDGPASDSGTYKITKAWVAKVNHFSDGCNTIENQQLTNRTCVYVGPPSLGNGNNPDATPSLSMIRPIALYAASDGNLFIADNNHDLIYYWNRTMVPVSILGVTIPDNSVKVVAGVGEGGSHTGTSSSPLALRSFMDNPYGLLFDGSTLYISDYSNSIVRAVNSGGTIATVFGGGASHVNGSLGTSHQCTNPAGLAKHGNDLFIACRGNHRVKRLDLASGLGYQVAGTGTAGTILGIAETLPTDATNGRLNEPWGLATDALGNLFISEAVACRVRYINRTAGTVSVFSGYDVSPGYMRAVLGSGTCGVTAGEAVNVSGATDARVDNPRSIALSDNVLFVANSGGHAVTALNLNSGTTAFGGVNIAPAYSNRVIGNGTGAYGGEGNFAYATTFNAPYSVAVNPITNDIYVGDYSNHRLRQIDPSDFRTKLLLGNGLIRFSSAGNGIVKAGLERMNRPYSLAFDPVTEELFVADYNNFRIRSVSGYGEVSTAVGIGVTGTGTEDNVLPNEVTMNTPRGVTLIGQTASFGGHLIYTDSANHRVRLLNRGTMDISIFGVTAQAGKVVTLAGTGAIGNGTTGLAINAGINTPEGVAFDGDNLYFTDRTNHCVKRIDSSGSIGVAAGLCGSSGNVNGPAMSTGRLNNPSGLTYFASGANKGLFVVDASNHRIRFTRLEGSTPIAGVPVSGGGAGSISGDTNTVACGGTYHDDGITASNAICRDIYGVTVVGNKFCFTNSTYHNVRCVDATSGIISTVFGPRQGIDDTDPRWFPGTSMDSSGQDNVIGAVGIVSPPTTGTFGVLQNPRGITKGPGNVLFIGEWGSGLIRKLTLDP